MKCTHGAGHTTGLAFPHTCPWKHPPQRDCWHDLGLIGELVFWEIPAQPPQTSTEKRKQPVLAGTETLQGKSREPAVEDPTTEGLEARLWDAILYVQAIGYEPASRNPGFRQNSQVCYRVRDGLLHSGPHAIGTAEAPADLCSTL